MNHVLTAIFTGSFLFHTVMLVSFKLIELPPDPSVFEMPERFGQFIVPRKQPKKPEKIAIATKPEPKKAKPKRPTPKELAKTEPNTGAKKRAVARDRVREQVSKLGMLRYFARNTPSSGTALDRVLQSNYASELQDSFGGVAGVATADAAPIPRKYRAPGSHYGIDPLSTGGVGSVKHAGRRTKPVAVKSAVQFAAPTSSMVDLDPSEVTRAVRRRLPGVRRCYEASLKRSPELAGKMGVAFEIDTRGRVVGAHVESGTMDDVEVANCVIGLIRRIRFPQPSEPVPVSFQFIFTPQ